MKSTRALPSTYPPPRAYGMYLRSSITELVVRIRPLPSGLHGSSAIKEAPIEAWVWLSLQLFDDPFNVNKCVIVAFQEEVKPVVLLYKNDASEHLVGEGAIRVKYGKKQNVIVTTFFGCNLVLLFGIEVAVAHL